jgi:hypothetical protein
MLGVSGIVPDGVPAVFLTAPDGSAVRADVHDNGFSFVVARARRPEPRYVVWTGSDGMPHVQPVSVFGGVPKMLCTRVVSVPVVTPSGARDCGPVALAAPARVVVGRRGKAFSAREARRRALRRPPVVVVPRGRVRRVPTVVAPMPPPVFPSRPCVLGGGLPVLVAPPAVPARALPAPAPARPAPARPAAPAPPRPPRPGGP